MSDYISQTITVSSCHVEGGGGAWSWSRCEPPPSYMWGVGGPPGGDGGPTLSLFRDKKSFPDRFAARMRQTMVLPVAPLGRYLSNPPKGPAAPPPPRPPMHSKGRALRGGPGGG